MFDVEARTCRSRGAHVACTRTYSGQCARKKIRPRTYIRAGSRMPTRAYARPGLVYMAGLGRRNCVVSCSWGANRLGRNGMRRRVHREGLDRTADGNEAWRTAQRRKRPCVRCGHGRNRILFIGRGLAYRKTEETNLLWLKWGSCSSGGVWRTAKRRKHSYVGALRSKRGPCSSGGVWRTAKRDST